MLNYDHRLHATMLNRRGSFTHWCEEHVRWSDTDLVGHVNNLSFAAYCETGRSMFLRHFSEGIKGKRVLLVSVQQIINFMREVHWPASIDIGTTVLAVGNRSCRLGQGLFDGDHCIGTGETALALLDEDTRTSKALPAHVRDWLQQRMLKRGNE